MIACTDVYTQARLAGAKPIILAYLISDTACRCFGKETPQEGHLDSTLNAIEWSSRVVAFGDYSQRLSSSDDNPLLSLTEEDMPSVTLSCDNVDRYFSNLSGAETFLGGRLLYFQGWDYPGITSSDFIELFSGNITTVNYDHRLATFVAQRTADIVTPDDPAVDTTKIYTLENGGPSQTLASEVVAYADMEPVFYEDTSWVYTMDVSIDDTSNPAVFFAIENDSKPRFEIGFDSDEYLYLKYTEDVSVGSPTYTTLTSSVQLSDDRYRISVEWDDTAGTVTFKDGKGQSQTITLTTSVDLTFDSNFGTNGSGVGEFDSPTAIVQGAGNKLYVTDGYNSRVQIFSNVGVFDSEFGSNGTGDEQFSYPLDLAVDSFDNVYVVDSGLSNNKRIQKFDSTGTFILKWGAEGTGDVQFDVAVGIAIDSSDYVYIVDSVLDRVQKFTSTGTYVSQFSCSPYGGARGIAVDSLGNIYITFTDDDSVRKFSGGGTYLSEIGNGAGSGEGEFSTPHKIIRNSSLGHVIVTDPTNNKLQGFNASGDFIFEFGELGSGDGEFTSMTGIALSSDFSQFFVTDKSLDRVTIIDIDRAGLSIDFSDTGTDDTIVLGEDFEGTMTTSGFNDTFLLVNDTDENTVIPDIVSGIDLTVVDGEWFENYDVDEYVTEIVETYQIDTTAEIVLPTTEIYSNTGPNSANITQPFPYSNLLENADEAVWGCPLINQTKFTYMVAGWSVQPVASGNDVTIYVDGIERSSGWTFYDSYDYEGKGNIAIVWFHGVDPGGAVSVRCNGKWVDGALLTNPVNIIEDFMAYAASLSDNASWKKNATSFAQALNFSTVNHYVAAGVIQSNNSLGFWIKNIMASFLGNMTFNAAGEIELSFLPLVYKAAVMEDIQEYEAITLEVEQNSAHVVNTVVTNYALSSATSDRRFKNDARTSYTRTKETTNSTTTTGGQTITLNFDWNRRTPVVSRLNDVILAWYGVVDWSVNYHGQDFKFLPIKLQDQISASLSLVVDADGTMIADKVYSLMSKTQNLDDFTSKLMMLGMNTDVDISIVSQVYLGKSQVSLGGDSIRLGGNDIYLGKSYLTLGGDDIRLGG